MRAQLKPIQHVYLETFAKIVDDRDVAFNTLAVKYDEEIDKAVDAFKKLKSGDIKLEQIEVTDDAWDIMPAQMVTPVSTASKNGKEEKEAKDAVPAASRK